MSISFDSRTWLCSLSLYFVAVALAFVVAASAHAWDNRISTGGPGQTGSARQTAKAAESAADRILEAQEADAQAHLESVLAGSGGFDADRQRPEYLRTLKSARVRVALRYLENAVTALSADQTTPAEDIDRLRLKIGSIQAEFLGKEYVDSALELAAQLTTRYPTSHRLHLDSLRLKFSIAGRRGQFEEILRLAHELVAVARLQQSCDDLVLGLVNVAIAGGYLGQDSTVAVAMRDLLGLSNSCDISVVVDLARTRLATAEVGLGNAPEAVRIYEELRASKGNAVFEREFQLRIAYAHALRVAGKAREAVAELVAARELAKEMESGHDQDIDTALTIALIDLEDYREATSILVKQLVPDSTGRQSSLSSARVYDLLARIAEKSGDLNAAIFLLKLSVAGVANSLEFSRIVKRLEDEGWEAREVARAKDTLTSGAFTRLADLLSQQGRLAEAQQVLDLQKAAEYVEFTRGARDGTEGKVRIGFTLHEKQWMDRYPQVADRLAAIGVEAQALERKAREGLTEQEKKRQLELKENLKIGQAAIESFLNEMRADLGKSGRGRAAEIEESSALSLRQQQTTLRGLGHDVVLVRYYITEKKVGMLLITPGAQLARASVIDAKELNGKIGQLRRLLRDPAMDPRPAAQELYRILVEPLAADLDQSGAKTVMLSLDGALRYLPFGALHDGRRYLVERWRLPIYSEVAKDKLREAVSPQWKVAGFGATRRFGELSALASVKEELNGIVRRNGHGVLPGEVYLDNQFTEARFRDVTKRPFQVLHIASHFVFSPGTEVNSFLLLGDGRKLTLGDIRTQGWNFANVDLLTLSACETGLGGGRDEQGREIDGFGVLAQRQGAKGVLATLWPVADKSTAILMQELYRQREEKGLTKAEALRRAQLALLDGQHAKSDASPTATTAKTPGAPVYARDPARPYAHPFYWGPFILMGNWR